MRKISNSQVVCYCSRTHHLSQRVRLALAYKNIDADIIIVERMEEHQEAFGENPQGKLPYLRDRDTNISDVRTILEYLEERYPHPRLLPTIPSLRAHYRNLMAQIDGEWLPVFANHSNGSYLFDVAVLNKLKAEIESLSDAFQPYFFGNEFSILDCILLPYLWRLSLSGVKFEKNKKNKGLRVYIERMFKEGYFKLSIEGMEPDLVNPELIMQQAICA